MKFINKIISKLTPSRATNEVAELKAQIKTLEKRMKQLESSNIAVIKRLLQVDLTAPAKKGKTKLYIVKNNNKGKIAEELKHCKILPFSNIDDDPTFH